MNFLAFALSILSYIPLGGAVSQWLCAAELLDGLNHDSGQKLEQNWNMILAANSTHIQMFMHAGTHSWTNWIVLCSLKKMNVIVYF